MNFNDKKEIKDKKVKIENMKKSIKENLNKINDVVIYKNYDFILDDIENNVAINLGSISSIFDYSEPMYKESREYVENNIEFINVLKDDGILHYIGNEFKNMFKNINISINLYIVKGLSFGYCDENIELDLYNMDIKEISDYIDNNNCGYEFLDYIDYLDNIYCFYDSLNDSVLKMINNYGDYIC